MQQQQKMAENLKNYSPILIELSFSDSALHYNLQGCMRVAALLSRMVVEVVTKKKPMRKETLMGEGEVEEEAHITMFLETPGREAGNPSIITPQPDVCSFCRCLNFYIG